MNSLIWRRIDGPGLGLGLDPVTVWMILRRCFGLFGVVRAVEDSTKPGPGTNGSQFFMVYRDSQLPPNYTVFGTIGATGLATLDKIAAAGVAGGAEDGQPFTVVEVNSILLD
jgi:peptidyl-prolyl cis-trans isomerase B (cyclophilin B)